MVWCSFFAEGNSIKKNISADIAKAATMRMINADAAPAHFILST